MRIWYQSLIDASHLPSYFDALKARSATIARPGVDVEFHGMPSGLYGGRVPSDVVIYPYVMSLNIQFILDNALRAQAQGFDVFAVGSVQDPALEEARSLLDIPVVAYGEASMHFACLLGSRFAVLAFQEGFDQMMDLRIKRLGLAERALPTQIIDLGFGDVTKSQQDPTRLLETFCETARRAIRLGAEAIIPGQLYLSEAVHKAGITRIDEVPVVDALSTTIKMAEAMGDLKRLGVSVTRRGFTHARPPKEILEHARRFSNRPPID
ncbi:MAG: aspartate/glutamate racemase family protein [Lautropia sp.]